MEGTQTIERENQGLLNFKKWYKELELHKAIYQTDRPFPHIVIDNFLKTTVAKTAMDAFPAVEDEGWIHYVHVNEKKHGLNKMELLPPFIQKLIASFNKPEFTAYLSQLTGIENLLADETLEGGGLHQTQRGGYLNIHADFTVHPHKRNWRRRVNLLIYLNENWEEDFRGHLELWSRDMHECVQTISPLFNRCVIFNTDDDSFHGVPDPIACPEDMTRKSIALYYYTEEKTRPPKRATNYRARPGDGLKSLLIYLDKTAISIYNEIKGRFGLSDEFASKILNFFNRKKRK